MERMRLFEEAEIVEKLLESGDIVLDPYLVSKVYELYMKRLSET
jgi:hypothetical protein